MLAARIGVWLRRIRVTNIKVIKGVENSIYFLPVIEFKKRTSVAKTILLNPKTKIR